jgi:transketolase
LFPFIWLSTGVAFFFFRMAADRVPLVYQLLTMKKVQSPEELASISAQVRRDIIRMVHAVSSGHPGGSLGCADFFVCMYFNVLRFDPASFSMSGKGEDMFFLSNGHISPVWYSVMAHRGFFPVTELATFRKLDSRLQGHPATKEHLPGIRVASGSLGQGLSVAIGAALSKRLDQDDRLVYVLTGDGEMNEGQIWEAALFAPQHKVDNLIAIVDRNFKQIDGPTEEVMGLGDIADKWKAFGWDVLEMDGNNIPDVLATLEEAKSRTGKGKPVIIVMRTIMGKGVDFMEDDHRWHGSPPNDEQAAIALAQIPETLGDY